MEFFKKFLSNFFKIICSYAHTNGFFIIYHAFCNDHKLHVPCCSLYKPLHIKFNEGNKYVKDQILSFSTMMY